MMDFATLTVLAINGLRLVMANPALGGGTSVSLGQASELLGILGTLIQEGDDAYDDLKAFTETVQAMADMGRAPTRDEWDILRARSDAAHDRLQAAKDELLAEGEEEAPPPAEPGEGVTAPETTEENNEL